jgi:hypothetical protein
MYQILLSICCSSVYFHVFCFASIYHQSSAACSFFNLSYCYLSPSHHYFSINTSSALSVYCLILLELVQFRLVCLFLTTFSSTILNTCKQCITFSQASFYIKCFGQLTLDFHFESCYVIFDKFTNCLGIPNSFKISYKCVLLLCHGPA